jgi:hypothetical protein
MSRQKQLVKVGCNMVERVVRSKQSVRLVLPEWESDQEGFQTQIDQELASRRANAHEVALARSRAIAAERSQPSDRSSSSPSASIAAHRSQLVARCTVHARRSAVHPL